MTGDVLTNAPQPLPSVSDAGQLQRSRADPHLDPSHDAIDAAVRALRLKPSDGIVPISANRITLLGWPAPHMAAAQSTDDPDAAKHKLQNARLQAMLRLIRSAENQDDGNRESDYHRLAGDPLRGSGSIASLHHPPAESWI